MFVRLFAAVATEALLASAHAEAPPRAARCRAGRHDAGQVRNHRALRRRDRGAGWTSFCTIPLKAKRRFGCFDAPMANSWVVRPKLR